MELWTDILLEINQSSDTQNFKLKLLDLEISLVEIYAKNIVRQVHKIVPETDKHQAIPKD